MEKECSGLQWSSKKLHLILNTESGELNEYTERSEMPAEIMCMALGTVPEGEQRSWFLAVGLADNTVRIISLDPNDCLSPCSMQALPSPAESLCLVEMGHCEAAQKTQQTLTFYELDLGLNHVVRKRSEPLEEHANFLISVPGGSDGPSGVLICSENYLTYKIYGDMHDIRCPIPRRRNDLDDPERGMIFICSATHRTKSMYFFLVQTEQGDIFKVTLETDDDAVSEIKLKYFDTVPPATSMCVLKTGFLFVASEFGNHYLYQIAHLGDDDDEPEFSSAMPNLANEDTPQMYLLCGRGPRSSIRVLRHGLEVSEMAVSELPGNPNAVWTVKKRIDDDFDAYIIVSFVNATLVLSIGETVEEVTDSGFLGTTPTLSCSSLGDDALVQVYPDGIRHIRADKRVNEWKAPGKKSISKCAVNQRQVVIALSGRELVYFEMDESQCIHNADHNAYTEEMKNARKNQMAEEMRTAAGEDEQELANEMADAFINEVLPEDVFSSPKAGL